MTNRAQATSDLPDPDGGNNTNTVITTIDESADVSVTKQASGPVTANQPFDYLLLVSNAGPSVATSLVVTDTLPASVTFSNASAGYTQVGNLVSWSLPSLAANATTSLTITVVAPPTGVLSNYVNVGTPTRDPIPDNNQFGPVTNRVNEVADVSVIKTSPATVTAGLAFAYSITVSNAGPSVAAGLVVTDSLPANVTFLAATPAGWSTNASQQVYWNALGDLAAGATTSLTVTVTPPGSGILSNYVAATSGTADPALPNNNFGPVINRVTPTGAVIRFYTDGTFTNIAVAKPVGAPLFVQAAAPGCNQNPNAVETNAIQLVSGLTGDTETFVAIETGPDTGLFRAYSGAPLTNHVPTVNAAVAILGNQIMETLGGDTIIASLPQCGSDAAPVKIFIDPGGIAFDSLSNLPLAGTTVTVVYAASGLPAPVYDYDGTTPLPATVVTGPDGRFVFPVMDPGSYRFVVGSPADYVFPTALADGALPTNRVIVVGSRGEAFSLSVTNPALQIDLPLDFKAAGTPLFIEKRADRKEAEIGDIVQYTITIRNNQTNLLGAVTVEDNLPAGFAYLNNTVKTNSVASANPVGAPGPHLEFAVGGMTPGQVIHLTYKVRVVPGALQGDGKNRAQARSVNPEGASNVAVARVIVRAGVFSDKPFLIGKVFVDTNGNKVQDAGEPGVPGVRLYLNNGTYVITDKEGKYSLYGLEAITHAVKVDETTVPAGWQGEALTARHNRRGTTGAARSIRPT